MNLTMKCPECKEYNYDYLMYFYLVIVGITLIFGVYRLIVKSDWLLIGITGLLIVGHIPMILIVDRLNKTIKEKQK
jgi:hypothetical protein